MRAWTFLTWRASLAVLVALSSCAPAAASEEYRLAFIGVALDVDTRQADRKLRDYLERVADVSFAPEDLEYARVIDRLANWDSSDGHFLARATPYVHVVAEMLGADLEVLATYVSTATGQKTYNSYLVVNRRDFPEPPTPIDVIRFLSTRGERPKFIYHSEFSTSSFFLPSLYLRSHKIFHMPESTESLVAIDAERISEGGSARLVEIVARGEAHLAAVWDGTRARFLPGHPAGAYGDVGRNVYFVRLPTSVPNDLLVCSEGLEAEVKARIRTAIRDMPGAEIQIGDFGTWEDIADATDSRSALSSLRWMARDRVAPVTVDIRTPRSSEAVPKAIRDAVAQAVRLSSTEFVLHDRDFHEHIDFSWTLQPIHDDALLFRSDARGFDVESQDFQISYRDADELTKRVISIIQSRMHRIRYVWPYGGTPPIVIRDTAFTVPAGTAVRVQRISWIDPERNRFRAGSVFDVRVRRSGFYKYELDLSDFLKRFPEGTADPMSNVSFRVLLPGTERDNPLFRTLTVALLVLLAVAAVAVVFDLRRRRPTGPPRFTSDVDR